MEIKLFQVDAFTNKLYSGNPAAVCPLPNWISDIEMQNIAAENNLSETAFFVKENDHYHIRWMTPTVEVDLCGHATLAASFVIFNYLEKDSLEIKFHSRSGELIVKKQNNYIVLNFPSRHPALVQTPELLTKIIPEKIIEVFYNKTLVALLSSESIVRNLSFDIKSLLKLETHGLIITASGDEVDFVSRFFAPDAGIDEDPVTGYAHTILIPFWSSKLHKTKMIAKQVSKRGGDLRCEYLGERVNISGEAVLYSEGVINI